MSLSATAAIRAGIQREAASCETNPFRLCGDWVKGTEARLPTQTVGPWPLHIGQREFELREYAGHTDSDLVLVDKTSGAARLPAANRAQSRARAGRCKDASGASGASVARRGSMFEERSARLVPAQLAVDGVAADAEPLRGFGDVATGRRHRVADGGDADFFQ